MSPDTTQMLAALQARQLTTPTLLFLVGHRPLMFVIGQVLFMIAPLFELFERDECSRWAALLSEPQRVAEIRAALDREPLDDITSNDGTLDLETNA